MFVALKKQAEDMDYQLKPMFNTAFYVAKQKLPFRSFEGLIELQEKNGIKMPTQYRNDKVNLKVCNRYVKDGLPTTEFIDIMAVKSADANGVLAALLEALHHVDLTDGDIKKKIIACTFDGASVNQGAKGGVIVKLRELLGHVLISIWCAPHKLELSLLDATKATDFIDIVEKGVDPIYRFYYGSGKRRREVMNMVTHFESVLSEEEVTNIPRQWPALKARLKYRQRQPPKEVISDLLTENHPDVKDVLVLVYIMPARETAAVNSNLPVPAAPQPARETAAVNSNLPVPAAPQPARETAAVNNTLSLKPYIAASRSTSPTEEKTLYC
ncbi:hypothetical protein F7725_001541 [Dissostichus mawsoni]|uniref:DUF4371 domain-containing protein n=1 Tax=Dissostichus mawsoni TaxID=36200 RepID=A0A7J5XZX9_DISMA|nr:hypothetical protein F7725_001541 [Dissostichus mawsoni]